MIEDKREEPEDRDNRNRLLGKLANPPIHGLDANHTATFAMPPNSITISALN